LAAFEPSLPENMPTMARKGRKSPCGAFFLLTSKASYKELCATAVGQGNIDVLGVAGPFGLVAPVDGAGFDRSLGHDLASINFIVWMQPAVTGSLGFCVCVPLARDCLIVTSDSTATSVSRLRKETPDSVFDAN
jgi:hypothetical protein